MRKPKRVLIIGLTDCLGGVETFIYNTTVFSDKSKVVFDFLVHGAGNCVFEREINEFYGNKDKHIFFISNYKKDTVGCLKELIAFYKSNSEKYDWIHFQSGFTAEILYVFPFCFLYNIPVISHSHSSGYNPIVNTLFRPIVNLTTSKRLACSKKAAEWLFGRRHVADTTIIMNGIDTGRFSFKREVRNRIRNQYGIEEDQLVVGHIGRFSAEKNHDFIIDIFAIIRKLKKDALLILVGDGETMNETMLKCKILGLDDTVIFTGQKMHPEDYYNAFDVLLMPSLYEGLPIVGIEAQCSDLNCFFSDQIDQQIMITKKAHMLSINDDASKWAGEIVNSYSSSRSDAVEKNLEMYSIHHTVNKMQHIYEMNE